MWTEYNYDENGNVTKTTGIDYGDIGKVTEAEYKYDAANRLISYNGKEVQYDKDGNMVYGPLNGEMVQYEYDCRNRLVKAGNTGYEYDAENNRIAVLTAEYREEYVVNTNAELSQVLTATRYERNATGYLRGGEKTTYIYGNGLVSQYTEENETEYYHYNNIGSTMYLTKNGVKTHEFAYSTYGELTLGEYGEVRFLYNGQLGVSTDDNGLYYMRARYYNPEIRRFINQDIVIGSIENSQSLNRYAYCQGNPVNYFDPFGLEPCEFFSGLGHSVLNILGLIPGIGDVFDIANAIWYFSEGKVGRGIEAGIASLPFIGNFFPNTRMFNYTKRVLNIVSYGGTACLAGQGMISGGQFLWAEINSGHCSGWNIALGIANIGLNGMAFFLSGKGLVRNVKELDYLNMTYIAQKAKWSDIDGGPELTKLLEESSNSRKILNVGAGDNPIPCATNIDISPNASGVIYGDVNDLSQFASGQFDHIIALNPYNYELLNSDIPRVLKEGGRVSVTGNYSNRFFRAIYKASPEVLSQAGFEIVSKGEAGSVFLKYGGKVTNGIRPTQGIPLQIILKKVGAQ